MPITITEALAEIKTVGKRIEKKREYITQYLFRAEGMRDPLEKDGGSPEVIRRERQAIADLEDRIIALRLGIQRANDKTLVTINGQGLTITEWLTWRRDVAPTRKAWLATLRAALMRVRDKAKTQGSVVLSATATASSGEAKPTDVVVNIDESDLASEIERIEDVLGQLDGQLSLKNATVFIDE